MRYGLRHVVVDPDIHMRMLGILEDWQALENGEEAIFNTMEKLRAKRDDVLRDSAALVKCCVCGTLLKMPSVDMHTGKLYCEEHEHKALEDA